MTTTGTKSNLSWAHLLSPGVVTVIVTIAAYLPGWLAVLVSVGLVAAAMSTINT